ncbi:MAG: hypothetical protein WBC83_03295 [Minisyncoccia bacterium]
MKKFLVMVFAILALLFVGCASQQAFVPIIETPRSPDEKLMETHTTTVTETTPAGTVTTVKTEQRELNAMMAELELKNALLQAQVAKAAVDPCSGGYYMPASCYGGGRYSGGRYYGSGSGSGSGGVNTPYRVGGGGAAPPSTPPNRSGGTNTRF